MKIIFSFNKTNIIKKVPPLFLKVRFFQVVINKPKHYALNERGGIKMPPQTTPSAPPAPLLPPLGEIHDNYMGKSSYLSLNDVGDFCLRILTLYLEIGVVKYKYWYSR